MNLPFILDIAIGLVFIYLIISVLASEIQELLTTLLQWRAAHLKKSIEILLTGGEGSSNNEEVKSIVEDIYSNPLVRNISQESREGIEASLRKIARAMVTLFGLRKKRMLTLKGNEPSYIPAETFTTTLLERLNLSQLSQKLVALNLQKLIETEIRTKINGSFEDETWQIDDAVRQTLISNFAVFEEKLDEVCEAFKSEKITLLAAVNQVEDDLSSFLDEVKRLAQDDATIQDFANLLTSLKRTLFRSGTEQDINEVMGRLQPNLVQTLELLVDDTQAKSKAYFAFREEIQQVDPASKIYSAYQSVQDEIEGISKKLSPSVRETFAVLGRRAQINLKRTQATAAVVESELNQFQVEVQSWFDRSMERASGVYKRNAKGIAFLIGFLLALSINADTFHIVSRLTTDTALRDALATNAEFVAASCPNPSAGQEQSSLECIRGEVNKTIPLPLGWNKANTTQQSQESDGWLFEPVKRLLGWVISGLAISMGASFWFDLLGKVINVRNSGKRPDTK